jgi:[acyl-carrier-protein] S-malonyltransferase
MGRFFFESSKEAHSLALQANDIAGFDLLELMFSGPLDQLTLTENAQLAIFTANAMGWAFFREAFDKSSNGIASLEEYVTCLAGHSLGEYNAWLAAGCASFEQLFRLVQLRSEAMAEASPKDGVMYAIIGIDVEQASEIIAECTQGDAFKCTIANDNCPGQVVISGVCDEVEAISEKLMQFARKKVPLAVSGPFHSPWMQPAAEKLATAASRVVFAAPKISVIANASAKPVCGAGEVADMIATQVISRVRWRESVLAMEELGVKTWLEAGHGNVLAGLIRRIVSQDSSNIFNVSDQNLRFTVCA